MAEAAVCAAYAAANTPAVPSQQQHKKQTNQHILHADQSDPAEIVLKEVGDIELDGDGEEEIELDEEDLEYEEEEEEEDGERYIVNGDETYRYSISPEVEEPHSDSNSTSDSPSSVKGHLKHMKTARKRPSDELDGEDADESGVSNDDSSDSVTSSRQRRPKGTPPKRAKISDQLSAAESIQNSTPVPFIGPELSLSFPPSNSPPAASGVSSTPNTNVRRAKKRSSEELSLDDEAEQASSASSPTDAPITSSKRAKVDL
jgi:hypothetical protein